MKLYQILIMMKNIINNETINYVENTEDNGNIISSEHNLIIRKIIKLYNKWRDFKWGKIW